MIEINVNTARYKVTVKGHAMPEESADYQQICAAASALAQSMMYCLTKLEEDGKDAYKSVEYRHDPGDIYIRVYPEGWAEASAKRKIRDYADGMELLAMSHPESIHMIWDGEEITMSKEDKA